MMMIVIKNGVDVLSITPNDRITAIAVTDHYLEDNNH